MEKLVLMQSIYFALGFMRVTGKLVSSSKRSDSTSHWRRELTDITEVYVINSKFYTIIKIKYQKNFRMTEISNCNPMQLEYMIYEFESKFLVLYSVV